MSKEEWEAIEKDVPMEKHAEAHEEPKQAIAAFGKRAILVFRYSRGNNSSGL